MLLLINFDMLALILWFNFVVMARRLLRRGHLGSQVAQMLLHERVEAELDRIQCDSLLREVDYLVKATEHQLKL